MKVILEKSPCCEKPVELDLGPGRVISSREQCPHCGEWIGILSEVFVAYPPGVMSNAFMKTPDGPVPATRVSIR